MGGSRSDLRAGAAVVFDERKIDAIFAPLDQCHLPGAAVGIAVAGRPVYRKAFGLASMELPATLTPATRMRIGSTTKHFACLACLLLCEEGQADLDDTVGKHLPELHPSTHAVTLRQLMGHTSGLRDVTDLGYQFSGTGQAVSSADLLAQYQHLSGVNCEPGVAWNYNNGGYHILGAVIERITGQALERVLVERIFQPVGMHDTLLRRLDTDFVPNSATLHMTRADGGFEKSYLGLTMGADGGIVSTIDDMLRWLAHMDAPHVGSAATWCTMKTPLTLVNGTSTGYGLGLMTGTWHGHDTLHHGGWVMGGNSEMLKVPAVGLDIVIMVNRSDVFAKLLGERVLEICLTADHEVPRELASRPAISGVFRAPRTGRVIQLYVRNGQQFASIDGMDIPVAADEAGTLRPAGIWHYLKLAIATCGDREHPSSLRFNSYGNVDELPRVAGVSEGAVIAGRYRSDEAGVTATLEQSAGNVRLSTAGPFGSTEQWLECLARGIWRARSSRASFLGGILFFDERSEGFEYSNSRTWKLTFRRERSAIR